MCKSTQTSLCYPFIDESSCEIDDDILDAILQDSIGNEPLKTTLEDFDSKFLESLRDCNDDGNQLSNDIIELDDMLLIDGKSSLEKSKD